MSENTLSRWSRRKLAPRGGKVAPDSVAESPPAAAPLPTTSAQQPTDDASSAQQTASAAPAAAEDLTASLPPIDTLDSRSDYTAFLAKEVPELLQRAALRKLWTSDPVLANLDGLNDYDENYHLIDTAITAAQTAYNAGRGYFDEVKGKLTQFEEASKDDSGGHTESRDDIATSDDATDATGFGKNDAAPTEPSPSPQQEIAAARDDRVKTRANKLNH